MFDLQTFCLFLGTAVMLVLSPGPDTVLILSRTLASGTAAGFMTLLGTQAGNVIHAVLIGIGVSTVILHVPIAYTALKVTGIVYLIYLAVMAWRAPAEIQLTANLSARSGGPLRCFVQGLMNNLANPKMIAFFLALFPQFLQPNHGSLAAHGLILGMTLALVAIVWIGFVIVITGRFRETATQNIKFIKFANRLAAITFMGLACRLAIEERAQL